MFSIFPTKDSISDIDGFYCDGFDMTGFIYSDTLCDVDALFTTNKFQASPIKHYLSYGKDFQTNFLLVNSGNANALRGDSGLDDIDFVLNKLKDKFKNIQNPIMSSTGVIGVPLPKDKILEEALEFNLDIKNTQNLANSIMTTDAYSKSCFYEVKLKDGGVFKIGAVAKGAGMINPSMATMLCFICTDANIPKSHIKELLKQNVKTTFNAISVDGDTSTNDTIMLFANKKSNSYDKNAFREALKLVMNDMAIAVVSDGEGAKKCVAFEVINALDDEEAQLIAKSLSNSLLVKTALFGEDPNWGRIASTIGSSGAKCDENLLSIFFGNICCFDKGAILFDKIIEKQASNILQNNSFKITCDIGLGDGTFTAFGCDLGYEYVKINAHYRT
jgi:glutamate N-acetyltransferase/amino-acid N-acetyltransferase